MNNKRQESIWQGLNLPTEGRGHYLKKWTYHKTWIRLSSQKEVVVADRMPSGGVPRLIEPPRILSGLFYQPCYSASTCSTIQMRLKQVGDWDEECPQGSQTQPWVCMSERVCGWVGERVGVCVHVHVSVWDSWALKRLKTELCTRVVCKIKHNVRIFPNSEASCWGCRLCWSGISLHSAVITQYSVSNDDMITG